MPLVPIGDVVEGPEGTFEEVPSPRDLPDPDSETAA
jgi:hypothetical protein